MCWAFLGILMINVVIGNDIPNKRLISSVPPLNMAYNDVPILITISFAEALNTETYQYILKILNNNNIPLNIFVSNLYTNYRLVNQLYRDGCEIGVHTVTKTAQLTSNLTKWYHEITKSREYLSKHAGIPISDINGYRSPSLITSDNMFNVLANNQFLYDQTVVQELNKYDEFNFPYTYDKYNNSILYEYGEGPSKSYPSLWEIPVYFLYDDSGNKYVFPTNYQGTYTSLLSMFKYSYNLRKNGNHAPMGLHFQMSWLSDDNYARALNDFITWALNQGNTWFVTNQQLIKWMNNPVSNAIINQNPTAYFPNNNNAISETFYECLYDTMTLYTIQETCPDTAPAIKYDGTLVYTHLHVSSSTWNVRDEYVDLCEWLRNDTFKLEKVYCETTKDTGITEFVRFDNSTFECRWYTQWQPPTKGEELWQSWIWRQDCLELNRTFIYGDIYPYGTETVFIDNNFDLMIRQNDGFLVDDILIDGISIKYNPNIFKNYDININNISNYVNVSIRFCDEIPKKSYNIYIDFINIDSISDNYTHLMPVDMNPKWCGYQTNSVSLISLNPIIFLLFVCVTIILS